MLYEPIKDQALTWDRCFLCGVNLDNSNRTEEHIFPRWLLHRFNLWDRQLALLNRTDIAYREMTVPSCRTCNQLHLGKVEDRIKDALDAGYDSFVALEPVVKFQWLLKIFYTVLFRELTLAFDRRQGIEAGTIFSSELLEEFNTSHLFLQSTRFETEFIGGPPWSLFHFKTHTYRDDSLNFDFLDNLPALSIGLRLGDIGIIGCLEDQNATEQLKGRDFERFLAYPLHWLQFKELCVRVFYQQSRLNFVPKYITKLPDKGGPMQIVSLPLRGLSAKPVYSEHNPERYARMLCLYTGSDFEKVFYPPDQVMTWLYNEDGSIKTMEADTF